MSFLEDYDVSTESAIEITEAQEYMENNKKCFHCDAPTKVSKKGNLYCSNICWLEQEDELLKK